MRGPNYPHTDVLQIGLLHPAICLMSSNVGSTLLLVAVILSWISEGDYD